MKKDFSITIATEKTIHDVFNAINNIEGWWITKIDGGSTKLNDEFSVRFDDIHYSKQRLIEFDPPKKVTWLVTDSKLTFLDDEKEWNGTTITFELTGKGNTTEIRFTHQGLVPGIECYSDCSNAWGDYIKGSLLQFINEGKGHPYEPKRIKVTS